MDTSPEYINMCRKATELQEKWEPEPGDFYRLPGHFITCIVLKNSLIDMDAIWLPRIDQLIDIMHNNARIKNIEAVKINIISYLSESEIRASVEIDYDQYGTGYYSSKKNDSIQAFLLKEIYHIAYHKHWNGDDWIKL